jgi:hypothetical protein
MDAQKDVQPPKQQPMIYICGGKIDIHLNNALLKKTTTTQKSSLT